MIKPGGVLGRRYEVRNRIGSGGMADVYKALDRKLNRFVALKVLKPEFRNDDMFLKRFESEAQAAGGLMHPNVVNVYDVGSDQGIYYIVMELVDGITLKEYIEKKGRLGWQEAISIGIQVCAGIESAHEKQIIHRDIKPQNVIISREGKVKVTDFGIAKPVTSTTVTTNVLGSVHYTSPEQARGAAVDMRSDIYSMGVTLFEMVTGEVPFDGDSAVSVAVKHLNEPIRKPSDIEPEVPRFLEEIILKCTEKNPALRYQSMPALIKDLRLALRNPDGHVAAMEHVRNRKPASGTRNTSQASDRNMKARSGQQNRKPQNVEPEEDTGMSRISKILAIVVAGIIGIAIVIMLLKGVGLFKAKPGKDTPKVEDAEKDLVKVPDVLGMTKEEAIAALNKHSLGYKTPFETAFSDAYKEGEICAQEYKPGSKIKKNTRVMLTISKGVQIETFALMDVTGLTEEAAREALKSQGIKERHITVKNAESDTVQKGSVISQTPSANTDVTKDDSVTLVVSSGESKSVVPKLVGLNKAQAESKLSAAGLKLGSVSEVFDEAEKGTVISQGDPEGTELKKGSSVAISISKGKKPDPQISIPEVIGNTESAALSMINNAGLSVVKNYAYNDEYPAGRVCNCSPAQGTEVKAGSTVTLTISKGRDTTNDPKPDENKPDENENGQ